MKLPEGIQTVLDYVIFAIETAVAALMLGYGYQVVAATFTSGQVSQPRCADVHCTSLCYD